MSEETARPFPTNEATEEAYDIIMNTAEHYFELKRIAASEGVGLSQARLAGYLRRIWPHNIPYSSHKRSSIIVRTLRRDLLENL